MPGKPRLLYWDASVFVSYFNAHTDRVEIISAILDDIRASAGARKIVTSVLAKVEVLQVAHEQQGQGVSQPGIEQIDRMWNDSQLIVFVEIHDAIALRARDLIWASEQNGWKLKAPDALHLASAEWVEAYELHTYDEKWDRYSPMINRTVCRPYVSQPRLPYIDTPLEPAE